MKKYVFICVLLVVASCKKTIQNQKIIGNAFGTTYSVIYQGKVNYKKQLDSLITVVNNSMSTYIPNSIISKINNNKEVIVDTHFKNVFQTSKEIYKATNGVFDPTIGVLVNAWDFGPKKKIAGLDSLKIDSLIKYVGFDKLSISANNRLKKPHKNTFLDFNAIAKGYGVDVLAQFLVAQGIEDYLVEIGGEINTKGINKAKNSTWKIGIEKPHFDGSQSVLKAIPLKNEAMATSGTYRKFKIDKNGNRYAHIINPKTGYPSKTNILSVSVIAPNCTIADGFATAFKAMGIQKVKSLLKTHPELKVFFVFENDKKQMETLALNGFPE